MSGDEKLIPPPLVVRDRLAQNIRERRLLRSLLRLSVRAVEERQETLAYEAQKAMGQAATSK